MSGCRALLLSAVSFATATNALGSGAGIIPFGDPAPSVKTAMASRQLVRLENAGGLLVAMPHLGSVAAVALNAPGVKEGKLIVRERELADGRRLVELAASSAVARGLMRATVFLKSDSQSVRLAYARDGKWVECPPQPVALAHAAGKGSLTGFILDELGLLQIVSGDERPHGRAAFGAFDRSVRFQRAAWHFVWPAIALAALFFLSRRLHTRSRS